MAVQRWVHKIIVGGLVASALAFGGMYTWNAGQGVAESSGDGDGGGSPKIATIGADSEMTDRD